VTFSWSGEPEPGSLQSLVAWTFAAEIVPCHVYVCVPAVVGTVTELVSGVAAPERSVTVPRSVAKTIPAQRATRRISFPPKSRYLDLVKRGSACEGYGVA
jgi:hypothetical protein